MIILNGFLDYIDGEPSFKIFVSDFRAYKGQNAWEIHCGSFHISWGRHACLGNTFVSGNSCGGI